MAGIMPHPRPCRNRRTPLPTPTATKNMPQETGIAAAARKILANELGDGACILENSQSAQWPDASMGCPQPYHAYAQVVTPGYKMIFSLAGAHYAVHTNADGSHIIICANRQ